MHRCRCMTACHASCARGSRIQVNEGNVYAEANLFLGEEFLRISEEDGAKEAINSYYHWKMVTSVRTLCNKKESPLKGK